MTLPTLLPEVLEALEREWQLADLACDIEVVRSLQTSLRKGGWKVTVAVHDQATIIAIWPGFHEKVFGMAVDVGSTTIAAHLCDLSSGEVVASVGRMNPQIRFGEDLMSRVSYSMMNPGGAAQMTEAVRAALNILAADTARQAKVPVCAVTASIGEASGAAGVYERGR